jgi:serine/threonine-protein kinase
VSVASHARTSKDDARGYLVAPMPPTPFGKYTILGKLGHGGMAEVNLAVVGGKGGFRKLFVLKRLHAHLEAEPGFVDMFLDEARLAAQLDHPNCVQTVEVGETEGTPSQGPQHFLAMEYLDGQGLERVLRMTGQRGDLLPIHTSARIVADALDGLGYAHDLRGYEGTPLGIVHRDVSPQNIFITYAGVVKLLDFGIAKAESNVVETRTGVVKGKYAYIAPEQALATPVDRRADLWSMGVVLWEMLTSRRLFKSVNELATLNETLRGAINPPSLYNPAVPRELDQIVLKALQRDADARYATAHDFKDALEGWLATQPEPSDRKAIAALMRERFGDILEQQKQRLKECIATVAQDSRSLDRLVLGGTSASMEGDAVALGSGPRSMPRAGYSVTPTPSPRPRAISSGITSGMPSIDDIAPLASVTPAPRPPSSSRSLPSNRPPAPPVSSTASHPGLVSSTTSHPGLVSSATSQPGLLSSSMHAVSDTASALLRSSASHPLAAGSAGDVGADRTVRMPAQRSRSRSLAWWLLGAASCVVSAVVAVLVWSAVAPETPASTAPSAGTLSTQDGVAEAETVAPEMVAPEMVAPEMVAPETGAPPAATELLAPPITTELPSVTSTVRAGERAVREVRRSQRDRGEQPRVEPPAEIAVVPPAPPETTRPEPARGPGFLSLVTSPWTEVTLEGRSLGETPLQRVSLPPGTHTLRLRNSEAGIDETYEVTIRPGEAVTRRLGLR